MRGNWTGGPRRAWTDADIGYLLDTLDRSSADVARDLGRTQLAVRLMRRQIRDGYSRQRPAAWSEDDDAFLRGVPHFSSVQIARHLGRSVYAVRNRRQRIGAKGRQWTECSPGFVGGRTLLAKTCTVCGLLLNASWFHAGGRGGWNSRCVACVPKEDASTQAARNARTYQKRLEQSRRGSARAQELSLSTAHRSGQPWLEADHKVLADPDLTVLEKAITLERSFYATKQVLSRNEYRSKVGRGDPVVGQWVIDNPNLSRQVAA